MLVRLLLLDGGKGSFTFRSRCRNAIFFFLICRPLDAVPALFARKRKLDTMPLKKGFMIPPLSNRSFSKRNFEKTPDACPDERKFFKGPDVFATLRNLTTAVTYVT